MIKVILMFLLLTMTNLAHSGETTYLCRAFQKDIDYWQDQYALVVKENKRLDKELSEAKMKVLEKGIIIPAGLKSAEVIINEEQVQPIENYHFY